MKIYVIANNSPCAVQDKCVQVIKSKDDIKHIDRLQFPIEKSAPETVRLLSQEKQAVYGEICQCKGTRAEICDVWNLLDCGATGFIVENDADKISLLQGILEEYSKK